MNIILKRFPVVLVAVLAVLCLGVFMAAPAFADGDSDKKPCTSILTFINCDADDGEGIKSVINLFLNIITGGVFLAATIGFIMCGARIITARDDPAQVAKARKRIIEIVVGIIAWVLIDVLVQLILPSGNMTGAGANG